MQELKKLICFRGDRSACFHYRLNVPMGRIAKYCKDKFEITVSPYISKDQLNAYDIAIFQRQYKPEVFYSMLQMQKNGAKCIYEIDDDLFHIPDWNPAKKVLGAKNVQDNVRHFLEKVDACFTTNDYLAGIYSKYCEHVYVLPNSLDLERFTQPPHNSVKPVVCWQGSTTHDRDVQLIRSSIERLRDDGTCFLKMWSFDVPGVYSVPNVPFEAFYHMFSQIDGYIGLAPVTTIPFNRSKSNLKFLEYTAVGMATIASNFGPYAETITHMEDGILINDNHEWYDAVKLLLSDQTLYNRLVENAKKLLNEKYNIDVTYTKWVDALNEIQERN